MNLIYVQFLIGFLMYAVIATASYSPTFKQSFWYYPAGLAAALVANLVWLWISKLEQNSSALLIKGLYWDTMLTAVYMLVPILFFGARLSGYQLTGLILIVLGLTLTKL